MPFLLLGQVNSVIRSYNILPDTGYISAAAHPMMVSRVQVDRPLDMNGLTLYFDGPDTGTCELYIFGHEGGTTYPAFRKNLLPSPLVITKEKVGKEKVRITLPESLSFYQDQFYILLDNFDGDFGLRQDPAYYEDYCTSEDGGIYYPTLLTDIKKTKWKGESCSLAMDLHITYQKEYPPLFTDVTLDIGIDTTLGIRSVAWGDIDGDGWQDLLLGRRLYQNNQGKFKDITYKIALPKGGYFKAGAFIDVDNNGTLDLLFFGSEVSYIFYNDGRGDFTGKPLQFPPLPSISAFSIADINDDGLLDVFVAQLWKGYPFPMPNYLFVNTGYGFRDATTSIYPDHVDKFNYPDQLDCFSGGYYSCIPDGNKNRRSRAAQFVDLDLDGDQDIYITNYFLEEDELYINDGLGNFESGTLPYKPIPNPNRSSRKLWYHYEHGTGVHWHDYDNDGDFDLLLPQLAHPQNMTRFQHSGTLLMRNDGDTFTNVYPSSGLAYEETHAGCGFGDINNDGLSDLVTTVYYGCRYIDCYLQKQDHTFQNITYRAGLSKISSGNDVSFVDFNNDGKLDMVAGSNNKVRLYENRGKNKNRWLKISLQREDKNYHGVGCHVKVYAGDNVYTQEVTSGRGQMIQQAPVLHFGVGRTRKINQVEVYWGSDLIGVFFDLKSNRHYHLREDGEYDVVK